jgi:homoserine dehydrogenase
MSSVSSSVSVGVIGTGTVGSGTLEILLDRIPSYKEEMGLNLEVSMVCARSEEELSEWKAKGLRTTTDVNELLSSPDVDIVVELAGGYDMPRQWISEAFRQGKHAVTANKALVAKYGPELFSLAAENESQFLFEAAIGGGIPIVRTLQESMSGNRVNSLSCIINGTCNYILTEMKEEGLAFDVVLKDAQEKGYAEADPTFDVDGIDSAHKLAILASLCSGKYVDFEKIHISGIRDIAIEDIRTVQDLGGTIKLLGIMNIDGDKVDARVHPCIVSRKHQLAGVEGVLNAVYLETDNLGPHLQTGAGAGKEPTASAVVADIVAIAKTLQFGGKTALPVNAFRREAEAELVSMDELETRYYLRLSTRDHKGVLASITRILSEHNISIDSILQGSVENPDAVTIGILTEEARENGILAALADIDALDDVVAQSRMIRFAS